MKIQTLLLLGAMTWLAIVPPDARAADESAPQPIRLSPALLEVLRAEMREIAIGVQGISVSLAAADWETIRVTAERIRASYIMEKSLTPAQIEELEQALPAEFKRLDAAFHQRAAKLGAAAEARDADLAAHYYARLLESCVTCHTRYAQQRFPAFAAPPARHDH